MLETRLKELTSSQIIKIIGVVGVMIGLLAMGAFDYMTSEPPPPENYAVPGERNEPVSIESEAVDEEGD